MPRGTWSRIGRRKNTTCCGARCRSGRCTCTLRDRKLQQWALEVVAIARAGLHRRAALDRIGGDEAGFLNVLQEIAESGKCPAEEKLDLYNGRWNRSVDPVFTEFAY